MVAYFFYLVEAAIVVRSLNFTSFICRRGCGDELDQLERKEMKVYIFIVVFYYFKMATANLPC